MNTSNKQLVKISIKENKSFSKKKNAKLIKEEQEMLEGFLGNLGDEMFNRLKVFLIQKIFNSLGVGGKGVIGKVLYNVTNSIGMSEVKSIMSGDGKACEIITTKILEQLQEILIQNLPRIFGVKNGGFMYDIMEKSLIQNLINNPNIKQKMTGAICSLAGGGVSKLINKFKLSEQKRLKNIIK